MARAKKSKVKVSELEGQPDPRAPLDSAGLLSACQGVLARLEADLLERAKSSPAVTRALEARYQAEKAAERTAESLAGWIALLATQVAAAWVLSCVFVRTLEDRGLLKQVRLAGPGAEDSQRQFFQLAPSLTERDYLLTVFRELAHHPAAKDLFDAEHSPVWKLSPSAAAAKELLALFRLPNATTPAFRFGQASTRFLGDLYQDLSEDVRKRYALLQTPDFVESFILDRTLEPAIQRFGLDDTTLIDPTCGSGHFLLGAFDRLFEHRLRAEPGIDPRIAAVKALDCVYGVDINPYAVAIARFRLTLSFLEKAGYAKLADAPTLPLHLVVADSLRINPQHPQTELWHQEGVQSQHWLGKVFALEDERAAKDVLFRQYAAVVGNPPYITVKDAAMREVYRKMYVSAAGKYALSVPFCERFFQLARPRGIIGQITANSFMRREFGKRLIEEYLPTVNLEFIVNTSGAYIPGHGTPTVLMFGTQEARRGIDVLTVLAKRGEPSTPANPSMGEVWMSIANHSGEVGFNNEFISVARVDRRSLEKHPWSLGGGGASELKELLEERAGRCLEEITDSIGIASFTLEDDVFLRPRSAWLRAGCPKLRLRPMIIGEAIRDWAIRETPVAFFPYDDALDVIPPSTPELRLLWPHRTTLSNNKLFGGKTKIESGFTWYEYGRLTADKLRTPLTITFAFVATHNHFALDCGGNVFKQSAPIIKLPKSATKDDHLALLAYLNSSIACFWMKQVFQPKHSAEHSTHPDPERDRYEHAGSQLEKLPVPLGAKSHTFTDLARRLGELALSQCECLSGEAVNRGLADGNLESALRQSWREFDELRERMIVLQEEIDWQCYVLFGLAEPSTTATALDDNFSCPRGDRAFERISSRKSFVRRRDHLVPLAEAEVPPVGTLTPSLEVLWSQRATAMRKSLELSLIEQPLYKRQWRDTDDNVDEFSFRAGHDRARLSEWLLARLEKTFADSASIQRIRDATARTELPEQLESVARYMATNELDAQAVLTRYVAEDSVPWCVACRHSDAGQTVHAIWEAIWNLQRREDAGQVVGNIPVPPKYDSKDYREASYWRLRGPLDVPKERFISYPGCESDNDGEPVYGWAGWDHLQRTKALASLYLNRKDVEGWTADRLTPMLAGLLELIPWVKQWHNEPSEEFGGLRMGDYYEQFLDGECRLHGLTHDDLRAWRPAKKTRGGAKGAAKATVAKADDEATESGNGHNGDEAPTSKKPRRKKQPAAAKEPPAGEEAE